MMTQAEVDSKSFNLEIKQQHAVPKETNWMYVQATPRRRLDGSTALYGVQINITRRKQTEEKIQALLQEKETLLKEVHHRIKNNMNTIAGLLMMQAEDHENQVVKQAIQEAEGRVRSMIQTELSDIQLPPKQMLPLGIILNELATNALKYAYPDRRQGRLRVTARQEANRLSIILRMTASG